MILVDALDIDRKWRERHRKRADLGATGRMDRGSSVRLPFGPPATNTDPTSSLPPVLNGTWRSRGLPLASKSQ
jgi:hypothetical protein